MRPNRFRDAEEWFYIDAQIRTVYRAAE